MTAPYCPQQAFCSVRKRSRVVDTLSGSRIRPSLPGCAHERLFDSNPRTSPHVYLITATMRGHMIHVCSLGRMRRRDRNLRARGRDNQIGRAPARKRSLLSLS